jgi:hypothetical protein
MVFSFFGSSVPRFQIKLSTHSSNFNFIFVIVSELELFLSTGILTQNFDIVDLKKFLEKIQKIYIWIVAVTLKMTSCKTMSKKKVKKSENPKFYGQNKLLS